MNLKSDLVIFGASNILSDICDCALANQLRLKSIVLHHPETLGERDLSVRDRIKQLARLGSDLLLQTLDEFQPAANEVYIIGPTTPSRIELVELLEARFGLQFISLVHPTAYVSPLAQLDQGVFVGANSVIAPGATLHKHVFINRGVTIGHDTVIGAYSRVQPGCNLGGLSHIGEGVTIGIGATVIERLRIGDHATIGAGAVVLDDVEPRVLVVGIPAKFKKNIA